ncbi:MAG: hypothetical protein AAF465_05200 [Pseudomonadota bacterium]
MIKRQAIATSVLIWLFLPIAQAQNTGGVFGPVVKEGHRSIQYRAAFVDDTNGFAQRLHYQQALDSRLMWRVVAQTRKTASRDFDFDYVQGELFWDITDQSADWQTGVRFDVRVRDSGRNETIGVNWMNQFRLANQWQARALLLTTVDLGSGGRDGVGLQTRANLYRTLDDNRQFGIELFSDFGSTSDFADGDEQRHALGPFANLPLSNGWSLFAGALFGLTDPVADSDIRVWATRAF